MFFLEQKTCQFLPNEKKLKKKEIEKNQNKNPFSYPQLPSLSLGTKPG